MIYTTRPSSVCLWHIASNYFQLHTIGLVRTCRISSFCTVAWKLARLLLTRRIAWSLGDSQASCTLLLLAKPGCMFKYDEWQRSGSGSRDCCVLFVLRWIFGGGGHGQNGAGIAWPPAAAAQRCHLLQYVDCSDLVVSASDCSVWGPRFESRHGRLCSSQQLLRYTALSTGCAPSLQCPGRLSLPPFVWVSAYGLNNNNDGGCGRYLPIFGRLTAQVDWLGLRVGGHPALRLLSSNELSELSQWLWSWW